MPCRSNLLWILQKFSLLFNFPIPIGYTTTYGEAHIPIACSVYGWINTTQSVGTINLLPTTYWHHTVYATGILSGDLLTMINTGSAVLVGQYTLSMCLPKPRHTAVYYNELFLSSHTTLQHLGLDWSNDHGIDRPTITKAGSKQHKESVLLGQVGYVRRQTTRYEALDGEMIRHYVGGGYHHYARRLARMVWIQQMKVGF